MINANNWLHAEAKECSAGGGQPVGDPLYRFLTSTPDTGPPPDHK